jgi:hypothetical protein
MRHPWVTLRSALATALVSVSAHAVTTATVTVNRTVWTLTDSDFLTEQILPIRVVLEPGQGFDLTISYSLSVHDDGQPTPFAQDAVGCIAIFPTPCGPTYSGFDYAKAYVVIAQDDPRTPHNPQLVLDGVETIASLQTHSDSFAESLTTSGTVQLHLFNGDLHSGPTPLFLPTYIGLWVLANPIPEPTIAAQLIGGLGLLAVALRRRSVGSAKTT